MYATGPGRLFQMVTLRTKGIQIISYHGPPTPLAAKSKRFHATSAPPATLTAVPNPPYCFNAMDEVVDHQPTPAMSPVGHTQPVLAVTDTRLQTSQDALEARSQLLRQSLVQQNQEGKSTGGTYERHYNNYIAWFNAQEAHLVQQDPSYQPIPSLPVTVAKVTLFLHHEMTRPQVRT
ncbi:hypothetical protein B0H14DRAFT_2656311 [Mycena olivaceomarginata]|nr:hypothetical protein B0H14DRAFT_2656311 [Mycena olivaceomarginata]